MHPTLHLNNIRGHVKLNRKEWLDVMPSVRGVQTYAVEVSRHAGNIMFSANALERQDMFGDPQLLTNHLQGIEWEAAQLSTYIGKLMEDLGKMQSALHGLRQGNETLDELIREREAILGEKVIL